MSRFSNVAAVLCIAVGLAGLSSCGVVSLNNSLVAEEQGISASWLDSQVQYDSFWKKVKETAQVTDRYKEDFKEILFGAIDGRYSDQQMVLFIAEQNPQLDPSSYTQLQRVIEAGRNDFARSQRVIVDRQRRYRTDIGTFPNNVVAGALGFPRELSGELAPSVDIDGDGKLTVLDYKIVTSSKTKAVFSSGVEENPLSVFGD